MDEVSLEVVDAALEEWVDRTLEKMAEKYGREARMASTLGALQLLVWHFLLYCSPESRALFLRKIQEFSEALLVD